MFMEPRLYTLGPLSLELSLYIELTALSTLGQTSVYKAVIAR